MVSAPAAAPTNVTTEHALSVNEILDYQSKEDEKVEQRSHA